MNQYYIFLILLTYAPLVLTQLNLGGLLPSILGGQQVQQQGLSTNSGYPQPTNAIPGAGGGIPGIYGNTEMGAGVPGASGFPGQVGSTTGNGLSGLFSPQQGIGGGMPNIGSGQAGLGSSGSAGQQTGMGAGLPNLSSLLGGQGGGAGIPNLSSLLGGQQTGSATGLPDLSSLLGGQGGGAGIPNLSSLLGGQQTGSATGLPDLSSLLGGQQNGLGQGAQLQSVGMNTGQQDVLGGLGGMLANLG